MPNSSDVPDKKTLAVGDVISALFPEHVPGGREQQGYRPAVVVGIPERLGLPRFEVHEPDAGAVLTADLHQEHPATFVDGDYGSRCAGLDAELRDVLGEMR